MYGTNSKHRTVEFLQKYMELKLFTLWLFNIAMENPL